MKNSTKSDLTADEWSRLIGDCIAAGISPDTAKSWRTRECVGVPSVARVSAITGFPAWRLNSHFPRTKAKAA